MSGQKVGGLHQLGLVGFGSTPSMIAYESVAVGKEQLDGCFAEGR